MRKIAFVCPEPGITGGFNVIFRHAMELARSGVTVTIVCKTPITATHIGWHPIAKMADHPKLLWLEPTMRRRRTASTWRPRLGRAPSSTCGAGRSLRLLCPVHRISLLPAGPLEERAVRAAVDAPYEAPIGVITEAPGFRDYFHRLYGCDAGLAPNGIDKAIFTEIGDVLADSTDRHNTIFVGLSGDTGDRPRVASL